MNSFLLFIGGAGFGAAATATAIVVWAFKNSDKFKEMPNA